MHLLPHLLITDSGESKVTHTDLPVDEPEDEEEEATEQTRLVGGGKKPGPATAILRQTALNLEIVAGTLGLLIGLVKPLQRVLIGTSESATGGWSGIGGGLLLLAAAYATVDMLSIGVSVRAGEKK